MTSGPLRSPSELGALLDHTLLTPEMTARDVDRLCAEAIARRLRGVCVPGGHLSQVVAGLRNTDIKAITVVGFPLGNGTLYAKLFEALEGVRLGAQELDIVINISAVRSGDWKAVANEMKEILVKTPECDHKFIIEMSLLEPDELKRLCRIANDLRPAFLKTATGRLARATTPDDVARLRDLLHPGVGIKAAGGIRTLAEVRAVVEAGAVVVGTSRATAIMDELTAGLREARND